MIAAAAEFADWVGRTEVVHDVIRPAEVARMSAMLDRDDPPPEAGDPLPPLWHWMYFPPVARHSQLDRDGHPERGDFLPPIALPRRMFAGARLTFHEPLRVGDEIRREAEVTGVTPKEGRSGPLVFVGARYRTYGGGGLAVEEEQDIVYRDEGAPARSPAKAEGAAPEPAWRRTWRPDPVMLFRYSAITFNGHRIHYDRPYATEVEGYPGLVVHGPLIATFLAELARDETGGRPLASFRFQAKRPLFDTHPFDVVGGPSGDGASCWLQAIDPEGAVAMDAGADFAA